MNSARAEAGELAAAARQYEASQVPAPEVALEHAELEVLGDIDIFCDEIGALAQGKRDGANQAQRAARFASRLDECSLDVLLGAALISAKRGDDEMALAAIKRLADRYLRSQDAYVARTLFLQLAE